MMGRIKMLDIGNAGGVITAENGANLDFELSAVLAYDAACLAVGQTVSFDLESRSRSKAVNVCIQMRNRVPHVAEGHLRTESLRYVGFEQRQSIRAYSFERILPGESTTTFIVTTDLALFTKHRVRIQEGPALCLRLLTAELETCAAGNEQLQCSLTERHLLAHADTGSVRVVRHISRRFVRPGARRGHFTPLQ